MTNWRDFLKPARNTGGFVGADYPMVKRTLFDRRRWAIVRVTTLRANEDKFQERLLYSVKDFARGVNRERFDLPFFNERGSGLASVDVRNAMRIEPAVYRVMVNPMDDVMDKRFVMAFMDRCSEACGRQLAWIAAIHDKATSIDENSRHCHIFVAGRDKAEKPVRFASAFKREGFRFIAETLATEILGPMTDEEVIEHRERHLRRNDKAMPSRWAPPVVA